MNNIAEEVIEPSWVANIINSVGFAAIHLTWIGTFWTGVSSRALWITFVLYWGRMFLITGVYHRYFSHRAYKMWRPFQFILAFLTTTSVQKGPLWWASRHVIHHRYSDKDPLDVHSPRQHGFWQAHVGWLWWNKKHVGTDMNHVKDWAKFPELHWLDKYHYIAPLLLTGLCYYLDGWSGVVVGMGWSTIAFWHATFSINSLSHVWGSQRYKTGDDSRNNWLLALLTLGEGWHNNHHHYQKSARQGFKWWEIDVTYYILWLLSKIRLKKFRLIWNLKPVPESKLESDLVNEAAAP
jgi:stearoyl-CoA desaturase (delta-9 desaturase)